MGDLKGFLKYKRELPLNRSVDERINDYKEIYNLLSEEKTCQQAARCMDCGVPFCHQGCPLGNIIPDFNEAVYRKNWKKAFDLLNQTNNFPEFTGRICPAPCEASCVLGINSDPITIELIEKSIIEKAYENGWVLPHKPNAKNSKVAIVGSGPAGLAAADQLCKTGYAVTVFEKNKNIGGLLRYGIPDFKLEKWVIDRRVDIMKTSGVTFITNTNVGVDISSNDLLAQFDAVLLAGGSTIPRDINIPGRDLDGVHFAMDYLEQKNKEIEGILPNSVSKISAENKNVIVIGGGDTGSDCVGTANREKAKSVVQFELLKKPPLLRDSSTPWPLWPYKIKTSTSHEEGCVRRWSIMTKEFIGDSEGKIEALSTIKVFENRDENGKLTFVEDPSSTSIVPCDLVLLAVGFVGPQKKGLIDNLDIALDQRGNVKTDNHQTTIPKVFAAGDMNRGQSLVVWAITEGRQAAQAIDKFLSGESNLDSVDYSPLKI